MDTSKTYDVICAGAATWDTQLFGIEHNLMEQDSVLAKDAFASTGGDALNGAVHLAALGNRTALCANIGSDVNGEKITDALRKAGVDVNWIRQDPEHSTAAPVLLIDENGERHIIRIPDNANHHFTKEMVPEELLKQSSHLHIASANVLPALDGQPLGDLMAKAKQLGLSTSMDASYDRKARGIQNIEPALMHCDVFIPSMQEASLYAQSKEISDIVRCFSKYGLKQFGIKLGKAGVFVTDFQTSCTVPSLCIDEPVDTTGAGDAFMAGYVNAWLLGYDLYSCALLGNAQSVSVLAHRGANGGAYTFVEACACVQKAGYALSKR